MYNIIELNVMFNCVVWVVELFEDLFGYYNRKKFKTRIWYATRITRINGQNMYTGQNSINNMDTYDIIEFEQQCVERYYCVYLLIRFNLKDIITIFKIMLITMQYLLHTCTEPCLSAGVKLPNVPCLGISGHAATPPFKFVYVLFITIWSLWCFW